MGITLWAKAYNTFLPKIIWKLIHLIGESFSYSTLHNMLFRMYMLQISTFGAHSISLIFMERSISYETNCTKHVSICAYMLIFENNYSIYFKIYLDGLIQTSEDLMTTIKSNHKHFCIKDIVGMWANTIFTRCWQVSLSVILIHEVGN